MKKIRVIEIWFLITQLKISKLGYARTLSETSWLSTLSICLTVLRFGAPFTIKLVLPARKLTPCLGKPKSVKTYTVHEICGMHHIICIMTVL